MRQITQVFAWACVKMLPFPKNFIAEDKYEEQSYELTKYRHFHTATTVEGLIWNRNVGLSEWHVCFLLLFLDF